MLDGTLDAEPIVAFVAAATRGVSPCCSTSWKLRNPFARVVNVGGGEKCVLDWNIDEGLLSPLGFRYMSPPQRNSAV